MPRPSEGQDPGAGIVRDVVPDLPATALDAARVVLLVIERPEAVPLLAIRNFLGIRLQRRARRTLERSSWAMAGEEMHGSAAAVIPLWFLRGRSAAGWAT